MCVNSGDEVRPTLRFGSASWMLQTEARQNVDIRAICLFMVDPFYGPTIFENNIFIMWSTRVCVWVFVCLLHVHNYSILGSMANHTRPTQSTHNHTPHTLKLATGCHSRCMLNTRRSLCVSCHIVFCVRKERRKRHNRISRHIKHYCIIDALLRCAAQLFNFCLLYICLLLFVAGQCVCVCHCRLPKTTLFSIHGWCRFLVCSRNAHHE